MENSFSDKSKESNGRLYLANKFLSLKQIYSSKNF